MCLQTNFCSHRMGSLRSSIEICPTILSMASSLQRCFGMHAIMHSVFQWLEDYSLARSLKRKFDCYLICCKTGNQMWEKGLDHSQCSLRPESVEHLAWSWNRNPYSSNGRVKSSNYLWESPNTFNWRIGSEQKVRMQNHFPLDHPMKMKPWSNWRMESGYYPFLL